MPCLIVWLTDLSRFTLLTAFPLILTPPLVAKYVPSLQMSKWIFQSHQTSGWCYLGPKPTRLNHSLGHCQITEPPSELWGWVSTASLRMNSIKVFPLISEVQFAFPMIFPPQIYVSETSCFSIWISVNLIIWLFYIPPPFFFLHPL